MFKKGAKEVRRKKFTPAHSYSLLGRKFKNYRVDANVSRPASFKHDSSLSDNAANNIKRHA